MNRTRTIVTRPTILILPLPGTLVRVEDAFTAMRRVDDCLVSFQVDHSPRVGVLGPFGRGQDAQPETHAAVQRQDFADDLVGAVEGGV